MNADSLKNAIEETHRFLSKAVRAQQRLKDDKYAYAGSQETAACKRASMDLTKALAKLRRP